MRSDELALARIVAQGLAEPQGSPAEVAQRLGCMQSQELPGGLLSLALRSASGSLDEVAEAFCAGQVVRSWPMRGTLHTVPAADIGWMTRLTSTKMAAQSARMHERWGLDEGAVDRAAEAARELLGGGRTATRAELLAAMAERGLPKGASRVLAHLSHTGVLVLGPVVADAAGRPDQHWALADEWIPNPRQLEGADAIREWVRTYFTSHGPASVADFARWTTLGLTVTRAALAELGDELASVEVDGVTHWMAPDLPDRLAAQRGAAARMMLLPGFDELLLGYKYRDFIVRPEFAEAIVPGNNGMFRPTVVDGGQVVATWRRGTSKKQHPTGYAVTWLVEPTRAQQARFDELTAALPRLDARPH